MNIRRIIGIVIVLIGIGLLITSSYIKTQVAEGKMQIAAGQQKVDTANSLFSLSPATKSVGQQVLTDPAQKKIDAGKGLVNEYTILADRLQIGGIVFIVLGAVVVFIPRKKHR